MNHNYESFTVMLGDGDVRFNCPELTQCNVNVAYNSSGSGGGDRLLIAY